MNYVLRDTITGRSTTISSRSPENIYWTTGNNIYAFDAFYYSYFLTGNYNFTNWELKDALYSSYPLGARGLKYFDPDSGILFFTDLNALPPQPWSMDVYTGNTSINNNILSGFQLAKTISGDVESAQNQYSFGISIDYKNNVLIAGSPGDYSSSYTAGSSGSAYIFTGSKNNWTRIIKLTGSNSTLPDFINNGFGASVSLNSQGNIAAVSSPFESAISNSNLNGFHKGCVYIFSGNNSNWTQTSRLTGNMAIIPANGSQDASFGKKIKLNSIGDTLYVLSAYSLNIFTGNNNTWNLAKTFTSTRATNTTPWPLDDFNLNKLENILYLSSGRSNYSIPSWQDNLGINIFSGSKSNWNENGQVILSNSPSFGYPSTSFIPNFSGNILAIRGITQNSVPLTRTIQIYKEKLNQNITFPAISDKSFADPVFFLSGSSDSNLPLSYSSSNVLVASISGTTGVKINNVGSVIVTANQAGDSNYEAAIPVSRSFNVVCDYIKEISAGRNHSLALLKDGGVTGWGNNGGGQTTIPAGIGTNAAGVSAGQIHSLALLKGGGVIGWGNNSFGQTTIPAGIGTNAAGVSAGQYHSLALLKNGSVVGWGRNDYGQINIPAGIGTNATGIAAGGEHCLALLKNGEVIGWGRSLEGQTTTPVGVGTNATGIAAGLVHSLALLKDGRVTGWGNNALGQINIPTAIGTNAAQISAGKEHSLALLKNGSVVGWGSNNKGQITIPVGIGTGAASIEAGGDYSFAILKDGQIIGWGENDFGQTNVPKSINCAFGPVYQNITFPEISDKNYGTSPFYLSGFSDSNLPLTYSSSNSSIASIISGSGIQVNNFGNVTITASQNGNSNFEPAPPISQSFNVVCDYIKEISAGGLHSLALLGDGSVTGWGNSQYGQTTIPVGIGTGAAAVSASEAQYSLALLKNGRVTGWGRNNYGQLDVPNNITGAIAISAGVYSSLALLKDGRITGWGSNSYDLLDIPVGIGTNAAAISTKFNHSLALLKDGRVTGWGVGGQGQINIPTGIGTGAAAISAGYYHSLALLKDGRVIGWGDNTKGQINIPTGIGTGAAAISAAFENSFALLKDGRVTGWGSSTYYPPYQSQLSIPTEIGNNAVRISAGSISSLAVLKDGRVIAWGQNSDIPRILSCLPLNSSRVISAPTSTYILSGQNLSNAPLIGGSGDVPGVFSWTDSSFVPLNVGRFLYSVTFVPSDIGSYTTSTTGSFLNVLGIPNIITKPTGTSIKYGQTLVNSNLTDGVADTSGTFNWTNPQTIVNNTGINNYPVTFVPASQYYINALTDANVNVTKADQIINFPNITNKILGASFVLNATSNAGSTINYSTNNTDLISLDSINNSTVVTLLFPGTATITANADEAEFYNAAPSVSRTFDITQLPFISENDLNLNLNFGNLVNNLNFNIELYGSPLVSKSFDVDNNEPFYIGLEKDHAYTINVKSREKLFEFGNSTGAKVISSNSYINTANLNIDFSQNEPQLDISTEVTDFLSLVYRLDNIITPSGVESVNENKLKAFTIDYKTYITGEVLDIQQIPYLSYKKYELENYCPPKQVVIQPTTVQEDPCSVDFACAICSSALKIRSNNPSQTFIDIPQAKMPFRIYGNLVDYIFTNANPGFYRIALNDKLFSLCCQCKEGVECTKELGVGGAGGVGGGDTAFTQCKQDNLFDRPKNVNESSLNQKYGLYFLDAITLKSISTNYGSNSYYSGEIKNANSFSEGDKIGFKQYSYNFEQAYADIYLNNPVYKPVDAEFIYSSTVTGDKYFYTTSQLVDKINLIYNSTGIYTWLPMLYSKKPYYNYGPMLFAELKDESTIGLTSLKSGRLGEHVISLISAPRPNAIIKSYLVPKTIELQGSDDGLIWNKIISSQDLQPVNVLSTSYTKAGGNINYEAINNTKITREITVPISSTTGSRIVPSGTTVTSGELSNLIDQIESGNKQFATGNGATIVCVPTAGKVSNICGSGYIELWIPSGCPVPDLQPQESGVKEDDEDGDKTQEGTDQKTILVEESVFRLGFTDYR